MTPIALGLYGFEDFVLSVDELAYPRTRELVVSALTRDESGALRLDATPELRAEMSSTPTLKVAAFDLDDWRLLPGSSPELAEMITSLAPYNASWASFSLGGVRAAHPTGFLFWRDTRSGRIGLVIEGFKFRSKDIFFDLYYNVSWLMGYLGPAALISIATAWFAVRRGLAPLRDIAKQAARIDMESLEQRLPAADAPSEIRPLVDSVNQALARLDAGAARLRRFTANAAHELRTPLAILTARLDAPKQPSFLIDLQRDAQRIRNIVEQLLATTRLSEHPADIAEEVDLVASSRRVAADALLLAIQSGRQIEFVGPDSVVLVRGNRSALESVLSNLVDNALRAEPDGGTVIVRVDADASVEVIDHGEGIAEADRELVFEPFWRKSETPPGTGLGLAIAKELMVRLGGGIAVSRTGGGGATFKLSFRRI